MSKLLPILDLLQWQKGRSGLLTDNGRTLACALLVCEIAKDATVSSACMNQMVRRSKEYLKHSLQIDFQFGGRKSIEYQVEMEYHWRVYSESLLELARLWKKPQPAGVIG